MSGAIDFHGIARRLCQDRKATRRLIPVWIAPVTDRSPDASRGDPCLAELEDDLICL